MGLGLDAFLAGWGIVLAQSEGEFGLGWVLARWGGVLAQSESGFGLG